MDSQDLKQEDKKVNEANNDKENEANNDIHATHKPTIVGVECCKCKQEPFGADTPKLWVFYLHGKCGYCGEENAIFWKWE